MITSLPIQATNGIRHWNNFSIAPALVIPQIFGMVLETVATTAAGYVIQKILNYVLEAFGPGPISAAVTNALSDLYRQHRETYEFVTGPILAPAVAARKR